MEEDILTTTPEPSPEPESTPAPAEPEPTEGPGVTVVSVDELIDRLTQTGDTGEEDAAPAEPAAEEPLPGEGEIVVEDPVPGLIGDAIDLLLDIRGGMKNVETIQQTLDHPFMTTSFQDYTVTEGLLLLILLAAFAATCVKILKGGFQWLRW